MRETDGDSAKSKNSKNSLVAGVTMANGATTLATTTTTTTIPVESGQDETAL